MNRPSLSPSRASDVLLVGIVVVTLIALVPDILAGTVALAVLTVALIAWPFGVLVWLTRRWARAGDLRFVLLALLLIVTAIGATVVVINVGS